MRFVDQRFQSTEGWGFLLEAFQDSLRSRLNGEDGNLEVSRVREFYQRFGSSKEEIDIYDTEEKDYHQIILSGERLSETSRILDIGCGNGALLSVLKKQDCRVANYHGVDLHLGGLVSTENLNFETAFTEADFNEFSSETCFDHFFLINSLTYMQDLGAVCRKIRELSSTKGSTVTIVEPFPSPLWEKRFFGLKPKYRRPNVVMSKFQDHGFVEVHRALLFFRIVLGVGFIPISYKIALKSDLA